MIIYLLIYYEYETRGLTANASSKAACSQHHQEKQKEMKKKSTVAKNHEAQIWSSTFIWTAQDRAMCSHEAVNVFWCGKCESGIQM